MRYKRDRGNSFFYKKAKEELKFKGIDISPKLYRKILLEFGEILQDECVDSFFGVTLPSLGRIHITGKKSGNNVINKYLSAINHKKIYTFNDHSGGYIYKFVWGTTGNIGGAYSFVPCKKLKFKLHEKLLSGNSNYIQ